MGMFDEIRCEVPLPDSWDSGGAWFQTKSFPDPCMRRFTISTAGRLLDSAGHDLEPDGYITFSTDDSVGQWREYRAHFREGVLSGIATGDLGKGRFFGLASFRWFEAPSFLFGDPGDDGGYPAPHSTGSASDSAMEGRDRESQLLAAVRSALPELQILLDRANSHWEYEDPVYRLYHGSFKVFRLQTFTREIVDALRALLPGVELHDAFKTIVREGTERAFTPESNSRWLEETRPIVEAFFHARFFLDMAVRYGKELQRPTDVLPSGYAALLSLYDLR
jgi:hypothetical protein